ncbi:MAG: hypothetical protein KDE55_16230 [Novosphingobium sp.]|nr:hypothetical protein [Novosphingobium sp.]
MTTLAELKLREPVYLDVARGDETGLVFPAHEQALRDAGPEFLTEAFRAFGALGDDNRVARIVSLDHCEGGSTGGKLFMTVEYENPDPALDTELFVKFSRDYDDRRRDHPGRYEMAAEVPFAAISRLPGFPTRVPAAYFADYQMETGTGIIITERIPYGEHGIEPHRRKVMDHKTLDDPLAHYREVVRALARLAAAHKSGRLSPDIAERFPFDPVAGSADPIRYSEAELQAELDYCFEFARRCPRLLPEVVRTEAFFARMKEDAFRVREHEALIQRYLTGNTDFIALCHWNAHIDNCIFTRDEAGRLECGFIDWGRVGQLTFGSVLWGGLSAAHHDIWDNHLDELLGLFVSEYSGNGGPLITVAELRLHLTLHLAAMGVARVLAFPEVIMFRLPECVDASGPLDPMFEAVDPARNSLHIYTAFLKFWEREDFGKALDLLIERAAHDHMPA